MIASARQKLLTLPHHDGVELRVDPSEELGTIDDSSVDVVLCVGALEHMLERAQVVRQVTRVLKNGGQFVLLTPNGGYCWYALVAPLLGIATRHLPPIVSSKGGKRSGLEVAGLHLKSVDYWTFIPKGDMPGWAGVALAFLDRVGRFVGLARCAAV